MICKSCGREIERNSLFCNWCGEKQIKERKKKDEIKIPTPRKLASGSWTVYLAAEKQSITEPTRELCIAKAKAVRAGFIEQKKSVPRLATGDAIEKMMVAEKGVLSPSTLRGYGITRRNRFQAYMDKDISSVDWQTAISAECLLVSAKTVRNAWDAVVAAMRYFKITPPDVKLPKFKKGGQPYLDYEQIQRFIPAVRGKDCELAALLALHSLRLSELIALKRSSIVTAKAGAEYIVVSGSIVPDENNTFVEKDTNKTSHSTREIPVLIPRLLEILPDIPPEDRLFHENPRLIGRRINRVCESANLPPVAVHGLRRSFASLCYHLNWSEIRTMSVGGWTDYKTVHEHYLQEAQKDKDRNAKKMQRFYADIDRRSKST